MPLEILNFSFVLFSRFARVERSEVLALARLGIFFAGI